MGHLNQPIRINDWVGLRVWLIGASTGIGAALAHELAGLGVHLILSARQEAALQELADHCLHRHNDVKTLVLPCDVSDELSIRLAIERIEAQWGGVDLVIFNAGTYEATRVDALSAVKIDQALRVNLLAPIHVTAAALPLLLQAANDGRPRGFAFVSSVAGYRGLPQALTYGPGKAGLISFAESLWLDLHGMGLNTWLINPGFVRTRLTAQNDFQMPALIEPEEAAQSIVHGFTKGSFEIHFPKRFTRFMKLLRLLPIAWYLRLAQRLVPPLNREAVLRSQCFDKE